VVCGEGANGPFPAEVRAGAELTTVQQYDGVTVPGFQISSDEPIHDNGLPFDLHESQR
jgi:hypothetical protein